MPSMKYISRFPPKTLRLPLVTVCCYNKKSAAY